MPSMKSRFLKNLKRSGFVFLMVLGTLALFAVSEGPWDVLADWHWASDQNPSALSVARWISRWFDFWPGWVISSMVLYGIGWLLRNQQMKRAITVALCAALLAGGITSVLKVTFGRARPMIAISQNVGDGFHGPLIKSGFVSFPSGHTTTAFAASVTLLLLLPKIGVPATCFAFLVGWSRMYVGAHYLGDILAGIWVGSYIAWLLSSSMKKWVKNSPTLRYSIYSDRSGQNTTQLPIKEASSSALIRA